MLSQAVPMLLGVPENGPKSGDVAPPVADLLSSLRRHLDMDIGFISEFIDGQRVFRQVDSRVPQDIVQVGEGHPLEDSYCLRVLDGRLPELITDACLLPAALALPATKALPIGAHLSVPIRLADGSTYGTLCCFSQTPDHSLNDRDLGIMRVFADVAAAQIDRARAASASQLELARRIRLVLAAEGLPAPVYQPIYDIHEQRIVGYEALSRFPCAPLQSPDVWFGEAARAGLAEELEMKALRNALAGFTAEKSRVYLSLNVSPDFILSGAVAAALGNATLNGVVLEVTEHASVSSYQELSASLRDLRRRGLRLAVDDAGAGYASFRHILALQPDYIKLDMSLTRNVDSDSAKRALAMALATFARGTGSRIIAEGVETIAELDSLRSIGIGYAQGYLLGKPASSVTFACELPSAIAHGLEQNCRSSGTS